METKKKIVSNENYLDLKMQNNVVLFYGPNSFLLEQTLKQWTKAFENKYSNGDLNLERLDGSTTNANDNKAFALAA